MKLVLAAAGTTLWSGGVIWAYNMESLDKGSAMAAGLLAVGFACWVAAEALAEAIREAFSLIESDAWAIFMLSYVATDAMLPAGMAVLLLLCFVMALGSGMSWSLAAAWALSMAGGALFGLSTAQNK